MPAPDPDLAAELDLAVELEDYLELGLRSVVGERRSAARRGWA